MLDPPGHNYLNIENVSPASHTTNLIDKQKIENTSMSEPPSPLIATSTPLDGPSAVPGSAVVTDDMYDFPRSHQYADAHDSTRPPPMARHCYTNAAPGQVNFLSNNRLTNKVSCGCQQYLTLVCLLFYR